MRHGKKLTKLSRTPSHRKSLLMNLAISLFKHERIKTTLPKAKALRPFAEKLITKAKSKTLHSIRQLSATLSDKSVVKKLVEELGERFKKRPGGYTRIYKAGFRTNDNAPIALIELVDYAGRPETKEAKTTDNKKSSKNVKTVKEKLVSLMKSGQSDQAEEKSDKAKLKEETKQEKIKVSKEAAKKKKTSSKKPA